MNVKPINFNFQIAQNKKISQKIKNNEANFSSSTFTLPSLKNYISFLGNSELSKLEILETINCGHPLSNDGFKGIVYKYDKDGKSYVIKVARTPKFKFENEANVLKQVPPNINCQRLISYFQHPSSNCDILVSTFVDGSKRVLEKPQDYSEFFNILLKLDMANVLHGDLNMQNCLFSQNGIGLIDFGEGEIFKTGDTYDDFIYPEFVLKSNVVNLEHNGIPDCIQTWSQNKENSKEYFKNYLIAKAKYYESHAEFLKTQDRDLSSTIDFEENYSKVLKNPSDLVLENEAKRIDCLYTFEHSDTAVNYRNIPNAAIRNWNLTVQKAKSQLDFINNVLNYADLTQDERKYFEYQEKIISLFFEQFSSWSASTIEWLNSLSTKEDLSDFEKKFIENKDKTMPMPPDLVGMVLK